MCNAPVDVLVRQYTEQYSIRNGDTDFRFKFTVCILNRFHVLLLCCAVGEYVFHAINDSYCAQFGQFSIQIETVEKYDFFFLTKYKAL